MTFRIKCAVAGASAALLGAVMATPAVAATPTALGSMPAGSVTLRHAHGGKLGIAFDALGLTPGSSHAVALSSDLCGAAAGGSSVRTVTADTSGRLRTSFTVPRRRSSKAASVSLLLGAKSGSGGASPKKVIACVNVPRPLNGSVQVALKSRLGWGSPLSGGETITYDAVAHTLTVDVSASGFVPGTLHAAHIHSGSCQQQGPVVSMLPDLLADATGTINATRTVTNVMSAPPASGWYLNIHLGDSNHILSGGKPTLAFQPLLCGDVNRIDTAPSAVPVGSGGEHFLSIGQSAVVGAVGHFTFSATCATVGGKTQATFDVTADTTADLDGGGPVAAGTKVNINTSSQTPGTFTQVGSASDSTEIAADGQEVDVFYNDGVNWPAGNGSAAHDCFAGYTGLATGLPF